MTDPYGPRAELRAVIRSKLRNGMTPDEAAEAVMKLFYRVEDYWRELDISTLGSGPGSQFLHERSLICEVPRQSVPRGPDRSAGLPEENPDAR